MYNDSFEIMRGECLEHSHDRNKKLIEKWCKESGVESPVGYYNKLYEGSITIFTDKPGCLIGCGGCLVNNFKKELKREFGREYKVEFIEVVGGFVNVN